MTARARITQADIDRAVKAVVSARAERARVIMRLETAEIEIIIGDNPPEAMGAPAGWGDDDDD